MLRGLSTVKVCLITYGDTETDNLLAPPIKQDDAPSSEFGGIREIWPPATPTVATLNRLKELTPSAPGYYTDPLNALTAAIVSMCTPKHGEPSPSWTRIIYLITRAEAPMDPKDLDTIRNSLESKQISLRVLGFGFPCSPLARVKTEAWATERYVDQWHDLLADLPDAKFSSAETEEQMATAPTIQVTKSAPTSTTLTFGHPETPDGDDYMAIQVQVLKASAVQRPMSQIKVWRNEDGTELRHVETRRVYYRASELLHAEDDDVKAEPLPDESAESFLRAYKLGATLIPVQRDMEVVPETVQGLELLHFVHGDTYRREYHLGETYFVIADPKSARAQIQLSSLANAAADRDVYALCRYVTRNHADPRLCMLAPFVDEEISYFAMVRVPFREDVKRFAFPPLDRVQTNTGEELRAHSTIPTPEQQAHMDKFVDSMDLMDVDEHGDGDGWYSCAESYNPAVHGLKNAVKHKFLYCNADALPDLNSELTRFFDSPQAVKERSADILRDCASVFAVHARPHEKEQPPAPHKKPRHSADSDATPDEDEQVLGKIQTDAIKVRGTQHVLPLADPAKAFALLVHSTESITEACEAMQHVVFRLLDTKMTNGADTTERMEQCIRAYYDAATQLDEAPAFNAFLRRFKARVVQKDLVLWSTLTKNSHCSLITTEKDEGHRVAVTEEEATAFLAAP
ncbi:ATP-dependent DNA helicase yku80 [Malassezia vespertilionis]|nr:ATP-dependent DNA helicase yku80 [Malassezia vespertilionis]WFD06543.1 ATP-dependent DNA helicase yku80 [Malassezia vespertilionis]